MREVKVGGKRSVQSEDVVRILKEHGTSVTVSEAEMILEFAYKFAKLTIETIRNKDARVEQSEVKTPRMFFRNQAVSNRKII